MQIPFILLPFFVEAALILAFRLAASLDWRGKPDAGPQWSQADLLVLFFALAPLAILTHKTDFLFVILSWIFVILELMRGATRLGPKGAGATTSWLVFADAVVLLVMWAKFALQILSGL